MILCKVNVKMYDVITDRKNCPMRHENGNCLPAGRFCTAVNNEICSALHKAYYSGFFNCHEILRKVKKTNTENKDEVN